MLDYLEFELLYRANIRDEYLDTIIAFRLDNCLPGLFSLITNYLKGNNNFQESFQENLENEDYTDFNPSLEKKDFIKLLRSLKEYLTPKDFKKFCISAYGEENYINKSDKYVSNKKDAAKTYTKKISTKYMDILEEEYDYFDNGFENDLDAGQYEDEFDNIPIIDHKKIEFNVPVLNKYLEYTKYSLDKKDLNVLHQEIIYNIDDINILEKIKGFEHVSSEYKDIIVRKIN